MNSDYFHKIINLPPIPGEIADRCRQIETLTPFHANHRGNVTNYIISDGSLQGPIIYNLYHLSDIAKDWVTQCIKPFHECKIPVTIQYIEPSEHFKYSTIAPHIDRARGDKILNYFIDTGGTNVKTNWHQEPQYPLERSAENLLWNFTGERNDFRILSEVYSTQFELGRWTLMRTNVIHSVVNIERPRISVSIAVTEDEIRKMSDLHGIDIRDFDLDASPELTQTQ